MDAMGADARIVIALVVPFLCLFAISLIGYEAVLVRLDRHYTWMLALGALLTIGSVFAPSIYYRYVLVEASFFNFSDSLLHRVGVISAGIFFSHMAFIGRLFSSPSHAERIAWTLQLGLLIVLITRLIIHFLEMVHLLNDSDSLISLK
jgi:hypothetical protein